MTNRCSLCSLLLAGIFGIAGFPLLAQDTTTTEPPPAPSIRYNPDLTPGKIAGRSALLPGRGQFTNGDYWKVPLAAGAVGGGIYAIHRSSRSYNRYLDAASIRLAGDSAQQDEFHGILNTTDLLLATARRQNARTASVLATFYLYGIQIFDAYAVASMQRKPMAHPPVKAAFYSALLPGMGQVYNGKWWKVPIVYAAIGTGVGFVVYNSKQYHDCRIAYFTRTDGDPDSNYETAFTQQFSDQALVQFQQEFRRNRDLSYLITTALYLLNVVDAIVDGHLYKLDMSDDLSFRIRPILDYSMTGGIGYKGLGINWTF
jgi:hypothetical protein